MKTAAVPRALPLLVDLALGGAPSARQAAARALSNLACCGDDVQLLVAKSAAAPALTALLQSPNDGLREAAATAVWDLCYGSEAGRRAVAAAGAIPWLAQLLLFGGDGAKEAAAAALAELAMAGEGARREIWDAGAVPLLQGLAEPDGQEVSREVQRAAMEALCSLDHNSGGGGVGGLSSCAGAVAGIQVPRAGRSGSGTTIE